MRSSIRALVALATSLSLAVGVHGANDTNGLACPVTSGSEDGAFFSVVGVQGTGVHPRLELRELEKDPEMFNLFIQAFAKFQAMDQKEKLSYFRIASIHGAPFDTWDNVQTQNGGSDQMGYCPHTSNMFSTWHRPYLALFEQVLQQNAKEVAQQYPPGEIGDKYQDAAKKLRLPYWDWAIDPPDGTEGSMPDSLRRPNQTITTFNGTQQQIPNPLLQYNFHPLDPAYFAPLDAARFKFSEWQTTIRNPQDGFASRVSSRNTEVNNRITSQQVANRDMLYKLLTVYQPFNEWSSKAGGGKIGNVETLHDGIHNSFGLGHMGIVEVAAFDPAFWFHHCNTDRIVAMYQHRYPDTWLEPSEQALATFTTAKGTTQDLDSPLTPFHMNSNGDMWTSKWVRNYESFGYTYPELIDKPSNESLTLTINKLYQPVTPGLKNSTNTKRGPVYVDTRKRGPVYANHTLVSVSNETADATDWMAEINMPSDIQITYSVRAFIGPPSEDPSKWATEENYVGQVASLASPRSDSDIIVTANIMLTNRLKEKFDKGELKSLERKDVEAYLEKNFFWRIQQIDNTVIPRSNPPAGLNVTVLSVPIHVPETNADVPEWTGDFEYKPDIGGQPPALQSNGTEKETHTATIVASTATVTVLPSGHNRVRMY